MSKGKKSKRVSSGIACEAFVDNEHGHLVMFVIDHGEPVIYRQFWCARRYRNDQGKFVAKGFRHCADAVMEFAEHPDEELVVSKPNCDKELYTKLSVGCTRKNAGAIIKAMQADRDALIEEYGLSKEDIERDSKNRVRRRSFVEWLFETETEEQRNKRIAEKKARRKAKREAKKADKKDDKKDAASKKADKAKKDDKAKETDEKGEKADDDKAKSE